MDRKNEKKYTFKPAVTVILILVLSLCGCSRTTQTRIPDTARAPESVYTAPATESADTGTDSEGTPVPEETSPPEDRMDAAIKEIPEYSNCAFAVVNNNYPFFSGSELQTEAFEYYSPLDSLGRCGPAYANICRETMPVEERGKIGMVKPSGWHTIKYDIVDGKYLYNRCHLIGYQLSAENANERNLVTGTRYLNVEGMLPFENMVADYVDDTDNHVLYRVTPVFKGDNLLADGVLVEALSVEDEGRGVCFCVYCYNVQPGIEIDYKTGESALADSSITETQSEDKGENSQTPDITYVLNTSTNKFHKPECASVRQMADRNKQNVTWSREECMDAGYGPCGNCNP